jgi:hypothetical protein
METALPLTREVLNLFCQATNNLIEDTHIEDLLYFARLHGVIAENALDACTMLRELYAEEHRDEVDAAEHAAIDELGDNELAMAVIPASAPAVIGDMNWDRNGFLAFRLPIPEFSAKIEELFMGMQRRFERFLSPATSQRLAEHIDFNNPEKLETLYVNSKRKKAFNDEDAYAVSRAFVANRNPQGYPNEIWDSKGTGYPLHLRGLKFVYHDIVPRVIQLLDRLMHTRHYLNNVVALLIKPPRGEALAFHQDVYSFEECFEFCGRVNTVQEWVSQFGAQRLVHISGGWGSGETCTLAPLTVGRFQLCLATLHPEHRHPEVIPTDAWATRAFPATYPWDKNLAVWNRLIRAVSVPRDPILVAVDRTWWDALPEALRTSLRDRLPVELPFRPLVVAPILPQDDGLAPSTYAACWPSGFPHGSRSNGAKPRVTMTLPIDTQPNFPSRRRALQRLHFIATNDTAAIMNDTLSYHTGGTHRHNSVEIDLMRDFGNLYIQNQADYLPAFALNMTAVQQAEQAASTEMHPGFINKELYDPTNRNHVKRRPISLRRPSETPPTGPLPAHRTSKQPTKRRSRNDSGDEDDAGQS